MKFAHAPHKLRILTFDLLESIAILRLPAAVLMKPAKVGSAPVAQEDRNAWAGGNIVFTYTIAACGPLAEHLFVSKRCVQ